MDSFKLSRNSPFIAAHNALSGGRWWADMQVIKAGKERDEIVSSQSKTLEQLKKV